MLAAGSMTIQGGRRLVLLPDVVVVRARDESVRLLNLCGSFFALDAVTSHIVRALVDGGTERAIEEAAAEYRLPPADAARYIQELACELESAGLVGTSKTQDRGWLRHLSTCGLALLAFPSTDLETFGRRFLPVIKFAMAVSGWEGAVGVCARVMGRKAPSNVETQTLTDLDASVRRMAARSVLRVECKERSLLLWVLAHRAGKAIDLVVGVRLYPFEAHCWCEDHGAYLSDDPSRCIMFQPIRRYRLRRRLHRETFCAWASP